MIEGLLSERHIVPKLLQQKGNLSALYKKSNLTPFGIKLP